MRSYGAVRQSPIASASRDTADSPIFFGMLDDDLSLGGSHGEEEVDEEDEEEEEEEEEDFFVGSKSRRRRRRNNNDKTNSSSSRSCSHLFVRGLTIVVIFAAASLVFINIYTEGGIVGEINQVVALFDSVSSSSQKEVSTGKRGSTTEASGDEEEEEEADDASSSSAYSMTGTYVSKTTEVWKSTSGIDSIYAKLYAESLSEDLDFTLTRVGYRSLDYFSLTPSTLYAYDALDGFTAVIEPHATMTLEILGGVSDYSVYKYNICPITEIPDPSQICTEGVLASTSIGAMETSYVSMPCDPYRTYEISVTEYTADTMQPLRMVQANALCMYVRREVRSLTAEDLSAAMTAMFALWDISEDAGQKTYGDAFHSVDYLVEIHDFNAAWQDADHIHEGLGFFPQHVKMTSIFEKSVQAVDPSFSLPYWDYTIETASGDNIFNSIVFSEDMFGTVVAPDDEVFGWTYRNSSILMGAIPDSNWAYIKASYNTRYEDLENGFGFMRGPWNMNPSPYVSRFATESSTLPGCITHYELLKYDDMMDFLAQAPYDSHASTHGSIGGVFGCDKFDDLREAGYINDESCQVDICANWGFYIKELYRANYVAPLTGCTYDEDEDGNDLTCGFVCNDDYEELFAAKLQETISSSLVPEDMSTEGWSAWKDFICTGDGYKVFVGDHLESASPSDPSFWVIHPTQERLLHAKYMAGGFENTTWATDAFNDFVCSKGVCYEADVGTKSNHAACCYGHYQYDQLLDFVHGNKSAGYGLTNDYVMKVTDPKSVNYSMPYIYDSFSWSHCMEDFDALLLSGLIKSESWR